MDRSERIIASFKPYVTINGITGMHATRVIDQGAGRMLSIENPLGQRLFIIPLSVMRTQIEGLKAGQDVRAELADLIRFEAAKREHAIDNTTANILAGCVKSAVTSHDARHLG